MFLVFVGIAAGGVVPTWAQTLRIDPFFAPELRRNGGIVYATAAQVDGKVIIAGSFDWINGVRRPSLARLNADGSLDTGFDAQIAGGAVYALALQSDGKIVVGGSFTQVGGSARGGLARLNSDGTLDSGFSTVAGVTGYINTLAIDGAGAIFVGGSFSQTSLGVARTSVAKFNSTGSLALDFAPAIGSTSGTGVITWVTSLLAMPDGRVMIGGNFNQVSGATTGGLALLSSNGALDPLWTTRQTYLVATALARDTAGRIYAAVSVNSSYYSGWPNGWSVVRTDANYAPDQNWGLSFSGQVYALLPLANGQMLVGGSQASYDPTVATGPIARYGTDRSLDSSYHSGLVASTIYCFANVNGAILAAGLVSGTNGHQSAVSLLNADGTTATALAPQLQQRGSSTAAVVQPDGKVIVAGRFDAVGTQTVSELARLTAGGRVDPTFSAPTTAGLITSMLLQPNGQLLVQAINGPAPGSTSSAVARLNSDGSIDTSYVSNAYLSTTQPWALQADGKLLLSSGYSLARYTATGATDTTFTSFNLYNGAFALQPDGHVIVSGTFTTAGSDYHAQPYIQRLNSDGSYDSTYSSPFQSSSYYFSSAPVAPIGLASDGTLYVAGNITFADNSTTSLARLTSSGARDSSFVPQTSTSDLITSLAVRADRSLLVAGSIGGANSLRLVQASGTFDSTVNLALVGSISSSGGLALDGNGGAIVAGSYSSIGGMARTGLARLTSQTAFAQVPADASAASGGTLSVVPQLSGSGSATYQWKRNGVAVAGATNATLTLNNFDPATQAGSYTLVVTDGGHSWETDAVNVAAVAAPVITANPVAATQDIGGVATFTVAATGVPAPTYQWSKNNVPISGATQPTLTLLNLKSSDAAAYTVSVSNSAGTVTSSSATLSLLTTTLDRQFAPTLYQTGNATLTTYIARADGSAIATGTFTGVNGVADPSIVAVQANGQVNSSFNTTTADTPLLYLSDGSVLFLGSYHYNGSSGAYTLRRFDATGQPVAGFSLDLNTSYSVQAFEANGAIILQASSTLIVGGVSVGGPIARIRLDGTLDTSFSVPTVTSGVTPTVLGVMSDGRIYLLYFESTSSGYAKRIMRVLSTGAPDPTFTTRVLADSYSSSASGIVQADGRLVLGLSTQATDAGSHGLLRLNLDGSTDTAFRDAQPPTSSGIGTLTPLAAYADGRLLVQPSSGDWLRLNSTGAQDTSFYVKYVSGMKVAAALSDGSVIGAITGYSSSTQPRVMRFDSTGQSTTANVPSFNVAADVFAVAHQAGGRIYVTGDFDWVNGTARHALVRLERNGQIDSSFHPTIAADESIAVIAVQADGRLVIGGRLRRFAGDAVAWRVLRLQADGTVDAQFLFTFDDAIRDLEVGSDGAVVVAGNFSTVANVTRSRLAKLLPGGGVDFGFVPAFQSYGVGAVAIQPNGSVIAAYDNSNVNQSSGTAGMIRRLNVSGAIDTAWAPIATSGAVAGIRSDINGNFLAWGTFPIVSAGAYARVVRITSAGAIDPTFSPISTNSSYYYSSTTIDALWIEPGTRRIVVGGGFSAIDNISRSSLARVSPDGSLDDTLQPRITSVASYPVAALSGSSAGDIVAGGSFSQVDGLAVTGLVRWTTHSFAITFPSPAVSVDSGTSTTLSMTVQGTGSFTYQWKKDGVAIVGATSATLALGSVDSSTAGNYTLVASNGQDTLESDPIRVAVTQAPSITQQPQDVTANLGASVQFSVGVVANPTATYQWRKNGTEIPGETNATLLVPVAQATDVGSYSVVVTNRLGSVTSQSAMLTMTGARFDAGFAPAVLNPASSGSYSTPHIAAVLQLSDGRWLIGGDFAGVNGVAMPYLARLQANGAMDVTYPGVGVLTASVASLTRLPSGKIMVGSGSGSASSGITNVLAVRLLADGTLDATFAPVSGVGVITSFDERSDGAIYAGGDFSFGSRSYLVRLNADGSPDLAFAPTQPSGLPVTALAVLGDGVAVAASQTYSSSIWLGRYSATGQVDSAWTESILPPSSYYSSYPRVTSMLASASGQLVIAGRFGQVSGVAAAGIARFNADGTVDRTFTPPISISTSSTPRLFPVSGGRMVVDGGISLSNGTLTCGAVRLKADGTVDQAYSLGTTDAATLFDVANDGSAWAQLGSSNSASMYLKLGANGQLSDKYELALYPSGSVTAIASLPDGRIIVVGAFGVVNGQSCARVARLLPNGRLDSTFAPAVVGSDSSTPTLSTAIVQGDGRTIIGGQFSSFNGVLRSNLVRLNTDGSIDGAYNPAPNGLVATLALDSSGRLLVGGEFSTIGGGSAPHLARLGTDGALDAGFVPAVSTGWSRVTAVAVAGDGRILASGGGYYSSTPAGIVRLQSNGTLDATFTGVSGFATAFGFMPDQRIVALTGTSTSYWQATGVAMFGTDGTAVAAFAPSFQLVTGSYQSSNLDLNGLLVQPDGRIVVGGAFNVVNGMHRTSLVRLLSDGSVDPGFYTGNGAGSTGVVQALARQPDGSIVAGGGFLTFDGHVAGGLIRYVDRPFTVRVRIPQVQVSSGGTATLSVETTGDGPFTFVWKRAGVVQSGSTSSTLTLANVTGSSAGDYVCEVTAGGQTVVSDPISVSIGAPPIFTVQPTSVKVNSGTSATLTALATGDGTISYQWYKYNVPVSGGTSATLTLPANSSFTGVYYVVAKNQFGQAESVAASAITGSAPTISSQPSNITATAGNTVYFNLYLSGSPSPVVQWFKNGTAVLGLTGSSPSISPVSTSDAGAYYAVATNAYGSVTSNSFTLAVNSTSLTAPSIVTQPSSAALTGGQTLSLSVTATGNPAPTYQWRFNGTPIPGATSSYYYYYSVSVATAGTYDVVVSNSQGSVTSNAVTVTVQQAPTFTRSPAPIQVVAGASVTFSATVTAFPAATYQWQKDGTDIPGATGISLSLTNVQGTDAGVYKLVATNSVGTASSSATLTVVTTVQRGLTLGTTRLNGDANGVTATFAIEGTAPKKMLVRALGPTLGALGVTGVMRDPMIYLSDANGAYVASNNDWAQSANPIDVSTAAAQVGAVALGASSKDAALVVTLAPGTYTATVLPADGSAGVALVEVYELDTVPRLVEISLRAHAGPGTAALTCGFNVIGSASRPYLVRALGPTLAKTDALADPQLSLTTSSGTVLASNDNWSSDPTAATQLSTAAARVGAAPLQSGSKDAALLINLSSGTYVAQVTSVDSTTGDVVLEIIEADSLRSTAIAPSFVLMPQSQDVPLGGTTKLASLATGAPAPTYQWQKDGVAISGATSATYTLSNMQTSQAGSYAVIATNSAGVAVSLPATVGIGTGQPPTATHSTLGVGFVAGGTVTISNTLTYSGTATSLAWSATLPAGWSYAGGSNEGDVHPTVGTTGTLGWAWSTPPASPVTFTYQVNVPSTETASQTIAATATVRTTTNSLRTIPVNPDPLRVVPTSALHSADTNADGKISLLELTRVIELYNTRNGTTRTGCYTTQTGTEDGFAVDTTRTSSAAVTLSSYHSADENRDGKISLLELTRVIELYNYRSGTTRTGQYHPQVGTEDGFAAGP